MTAGPCKFPHTPHLLWLAAGSPRDDKVLCEAARAAFVAGELTVEEKIDGANVGLSVGPDGRVRAHNRGGFLGRGAPPQFQPLWPFIAAREGALVAALGERLILFGEWCFAVHSVRYDRLPDWFMGFDVYDREAGRFWSLPRRDALFATLGICAVPPIARGRFDLATLREMAENLPSAVGETAAEGIYLRRDEGAWLGARAKIVRPAFTQAIEEHWSRRPLEKNRLSA